MNSPGPLLFRLFQLLGRSRDMRQRFLIGVGALLMAAAALVAVSSKSGAQQPAAIATMPVDTSSLKGPRQPIFFRHDIHAGLKKIPCQYCHFSVGASNVHGNPSMQSCMGCHYMGA